MHRTARMHRTVRMLRTHHAHAPHACSARTLCTVRTARTHRTHNRTTTQIYAYNLTDGSVLENNGDKQRGGAGCACSHTTGGSGGDNKIWFAGGGLPRVFACS